jgi:hypothetical protein
MSSNKMYLSYSSLVKLCRNPKQFYKEYILGERETLENKYLKQGSLFHLFVLEPQNFDENFVVLPNKLPSDSVQQVIRSVWDNNDVTGGGDLNDYEDEILKHLEEINLYQSYKTDKQRIDKINNDEGNQFWSVIREADIHNKVIVDMKLVQDAKAKADAMLQNEQAIALLEDTTNIDVRKEMLMKMDLANYSFGLKGIIDLLRIDEENETIHIVDFKTTSKDLEGWRQNFLESEYMYWLQMMIYKELVYDLVPKDSQSAWKLKVWFPVVDRDNQTYVFPVSTETLHDSQLKVNGIMDIAEWHLQTQNFDLPYNYEKGLVEL